MWNIVDSRKNLLPEAVPTLNLPSKSVESRPVLLTPRRVLQKEASATETREVPKYKPLTSFKKRLEKLKLEGWVSEIKEEEVCIKYFDLKHALPKYALKINSGLNYTLFVYEWLLHETNPFYVTNKRSLYHVTLHQLISSFFDNNLCCGLCFPLSTLSLPANVVLHTIPLHVDQYSDEGPAFQATTFYRSVCCEVFVKEEGSCCLECERILKKTTKSVSNTNVGKAMPLKDNAPIYSCSKERLVTTVQKQRLTCKELESQIQQMKTEIEHNSVTINKDLENDLLQILGHTSLNNTPHMKLFWEQQKNLLSSSASGRRYHPQIIRFYLSLHAKSPAAYKEPRESGVLVLPSERTLRGYRNFFKPKPGISKENIDKLVDLSKQFFDIQRYVIVIHRTKSASLISFKKKFKCHFKYLICVLKLVKLQDALNHI